MLRKALKITSLFPLCQGKHIYLGVHIFCKIRAGARIFRGVRIFCYTGTPSLSLFPATLLQSRWSWPPTYCWCKHTRSTSSLSLRLGVYVWWNGCSQKLWWLSLRGWGQYSAKTWLPAFEHFGCTSGSLARSSLIAWRRHSATFPEMQSKSTPLGPSVITVTPWRGTLPPYWVWYKWSSMTWRTSSRNDLWMQAP